jgi:hypothetical protein
VHGREGQQIVSALVIAFSMLVVQVVAYQNSIASETNDSDARGPAGNGTLWTELSPSVTLR